MCKIGTKNHGKMCKNNTKKLGKMCKNIHLLISKGFLKGISFNF